MAGNEVHIYWDLARLAKKLGTIGEGEIIKARVIAEN